MGQEKLTRDNNKKTADKPTSITRQRTTMTMVLMMVLMMMMMMLVRDHHNLVYRWGLSKYFTGLYLHTHSHT